jgi:hypothetical protein
MLRRRAWAETPIRKHVVWIFACPFPPENTISSARPLCFSKYLSSFGSNCGVFTAPEKTERDDSNKKYVPDPFVARPWRSLSWHLKRVVRKVSLPGEMKTLWSRNVVYAARAFFGTNSGTRVGRRAQFLTN